ILGRDARGANYFDSRTRNGPALAPGRRDPGCRMPAGASSRAPVASAPEGGPAHERPPDEEGDASEGRDEGDPAGCAEGEGVEAAREEEDAGHEEPAGDLRDASWPAVRGPCGGDEGQRVEELVTCGELEGREALRREPRRERVCAQGARGDADQPEEGTDREEDTVHVVAIYVTPLRCGSPARRRWRFGSWTEASPWIDPGLPPAHTVLPGGAGPGAPSEPAASHGVYSRAGTDTNPRTAIDAQEAHAAPRRGADRRRHAHLLPRLHPP